MSTAIHAAAYLVECLDKTTTMQLQKLLYYSQGCHLALHGEPLFDDPIEAWSNGPVVRRLWSKHRRLRKLKSPWPDVKTLDEAHSELPVDAALVLNAVADALGDWAADDLVESTHHENPWLSARGDLPATAQSQAELDLNMMRRYFESACLPARRELSRDELSPAAFDLYLHFAHTRAFTPPTVEAENAEEWFEMLDAPPRDLPDLREFLASAKARSRA